VRYRDIEAVKRDFSMICERATVKHVYLADSSLFLRKGRAKEILRHLIDIDCQQNFLYELNLEHVDDELIELMAQLPYQQFSFGIQAVGQEANAAMTRKFDRGKFKTNWDKIVARMERPQLAIDLIYPLPGDTLEGFKESIEFALQLENLQTLKFNPFILLRGSEFFDMQEEFGIELREDDPFHVGACKSFPKEDVELARKFAFYALCAFHRPWIKEACVRVAQRRGASLIDTIIGFFEALPFDILGGEEPPEMLLGDARRERNAARQRHMIDALFVFKQDQILAALLAFSDDDPEVETVLGRHFEPEERDRALSVRAASGV
jgi:hypothetical protein